jgi:Zn finger protein HypA/HybF involved in hydrogenase expression
MVAEKQAKGHQHAMYPSNSVQNLIDKAVRLTDGQPITQIRAALGNLTGLAPEQVQAEFEQYRIGTPAANAQLDLRREPGRAVCLSCDDESPAYAVGEACPACGSQRRHVVGGQQLALEGVSVDRSRLEAKRRPPRSSRRLTPMAQGNGEGA